MAEVRDDQEALGDHFTVSFEGPSEADLAARVLESLDPAYWRIGEIMDTYPTDLIEVLLYTNEQFRDITRAPQWAGGAYDRVIRVPTRGALAKPEELDRVLTHEFSHTLVSSLASTGVPTWLNEGLAAAFESDSLSWTEQRLRRAGRRIPLATLASSFGLLSGGDAELSYASSAIAVRRIIDESSCLAVANLLRDLADGTDLETAFAHRIQRPLSDLVASFEAR